jgi:hypothetical protein
MGLNALQMHDKKNNLFVCAVGALMEIEDD